MNDINRVELRGKVINTPVYRESKNGGAWLTFSLSTTLPEGIEIGLDKDTKTTFSQVAVFKQSLVAHAMEQGLKAGDRVWLVGRIMTKRTQRNGMNIAYTSIAAYELEVLRKNENKQMN